MEPFDERSSEISFRKKKKAPVHHRSAAVTPMKHLSTHLRVSRAIQMQRQKKKARQARGNTTRHETTTQRLTCELHNQLWQMTPLNNSEFGVFRETPKTKEPYAQIKIGTRCGTRAPAAAETTMPQHLVPLTGSRDGQAHRLTPGEGRETFIFFSKMLLGETSSDQEAPEAA